MHTKTHTQQQCTRMHTSQLPTCFLFQTRPPNLSLRMSKTTTRPLNPSRSGSSWVLAPRHQCKPVALVRSQAGPHHGPHHHRRQPTSQSLPIMPTHHRVSRANNAMPTCEGAQQDHTDGNASILGSPKSTKSLHHNTGQGLFGSVGHSPARCWIDPPLPMSMVANDRIRIKNRHCDLRGN